MREILQAWTDLEIGPSYAAQPLPEGADARLSAFRDLAAASVQPDTEDLPSRATRAVVACITHMLADAAELDDIHLDLTKGLFRLYPAVLDRTAGPPEEAALSQILDRLGVLQELFGPKKKPQVETGTPPKFLGEYLIELGYVTEDQLRKALEAQKSGEHPGLRMGDILQKWGIITRAQLDEAIELQMVDRYGVE